MPEKYHQFSHLTFLKEFFLVTCAGCLTQIECGIGEFYGDHPPVDVEDALIFLGFQVAP